MNSYLGHLNVIDICVLPIYLVVVFFILYYAMKTMLLEDRKYNKIYLILLIIFNFTVLLASTVVKLIPDFPDANMYSGIVRTGIMPPNQTMAVAVGFKYGSLIFRYLSFHNVLWYVAFNFLINQLGIILIWKAWIKYKKGNVMLIQQRIYFILTAFYPMALLMGIVPFRGSYFLIFFAIFLYGAVSKWVINIPFVIGSLGMIILRKEYVMVVGLIFLVKLYNSIKIKNKGIKAILAIIVLIICYVAGSYAAKKLFNLSVTPQGLSHFRNGQTIQYINTRYSYPLIHWKNWLQVITYSPLLLLQFLVAPLPIVSHIDPFKGLAYLADALYVIFLTFLFIIRINKNIKGNAFWIINILILWVLNGMFEYYINAAVRHRYYMIIMLIALITEGFKYINIGKEKERKPIKYY
ncbi:hypothetical protein [Clostridium sp.]|uniref:hypothetical protein n=1 Tax=Clostridium sp. TaxID=1506 RepID=UPI00399532AB